MNGDVEGSDPDQTTAKGPASPAMRVSAGEDSVDRVGMQQSTDTEAELVAAHLKYYRLEIHLKEGKDLAVRDWSGKMSFFSAMMWRAPIVMHCLYIIQSEFYNFKIEKNIFAAIWQLRNIICIVLSRQKDCGSLKMIRWKYLDYIEEGRYATSDHREES